MRYYDLIDLSTVIDHVIYSLKSSGLKFVTAVMDPVLVELVILLREKDFVREIIGTMSGWDKKRWRKSPRHSHHLELLGGMGEAQHTLHAGHFSRNRR